MTREELVALRDGVLRGEPPYSVDPLGKMTRATGNPGLEERRALGDYDLHAAGIRMSLEVSVQILNDRIERMRKP